MLHEFDGEEWIASGFAGNGSGNMLLVHGADFSHVEERAHQRTGSFRRQWAKCDGLHARLLGEFAQQSTDGPWAVVGDRTAVHDQKQGRLARRLHQSPQQSATIAIGPLHIIDEDDHGLDARQTSQQIAEGDERLIAQLLGVAQRGHAIALLPRELEPAQDREYLGQVQNTIRQDVALIVSGQVGQAVAQGIDDPIESFER